MSSPPFGANAHRRSGTDTATHVTFERERGVYRIDMTRGLAHALVRVGEGADRTTRIQGVFTALAESGIPLFLIKLHGSAVTFGLEEEKLPAAERCLEGIAAEFAVRRNLALATVVATSLEDLTGAMVNIADSLQKAGARLYGIGDSHSGVQCLIDGERAEEAVAELERTFGLREPL